MAITAYSELISAGQNWLHRSSAEIVARLPEFIALAEAGFNYGLVMPDLKIDTPGLRVRQMETRVTATVNEEYEDLPSDFLEMRSIRLNTTPIATLSFMTPSQMDATFVGSETGQPSAFCLVGDTIRFGKTPGASYTAEMVYYQKIPALTSSATTNWLLTARPDMYLYGMLLQSAPYIGDTARALTWASGYRGAMAGMQLSDSSGRWSGGPLQQRVGTGTP